MRTRINLLCLCLLLHSLLTAQTVTRCEYFIDTDPGMGNATPLSLSAGDSVTINATITLDPLLQSGIHLLYVRVADNNGVWSFVRSFLINTSIQSEKINAAEYFIDTDPGPGNRTVINYPETDSASIVQNIPIPNNLPLGPHKIFIRTRNSKGLWGFNQVFTFNVCTTYGPTSEFDHVIDSKTLYFSNSSQLSDNSFWDFGDGQSSNQVNPTHTYSTGGVYQVSLNSNNICGANTITKTIGINGVQSVMPATGPTNGIMIFEVKGYGFEPGTQVKLHRNGVTIPTGKTIFNNDISLKVTCKNDTLAAGFYDIIAITGGRRDTLRNAIDIQPVTGNQLWFSIDAAPEVLINKFMPVTIRYGNRGNNTAVGVPISVKIPGNISVQMLNHVITTTTNSSVNALEEFGFLPYTDSATNTAYKIGFFLVPYIEPNTENSIRLEMKTPVAGLFDVDVLAGGEWYNAGDLIEVDSVSSTGRTAVNCNMDDWPSCMKCLFSAADNIPGVNCITSLVSMGCTIKDELNNPTDGFGTAKKAFNVASSVAAAVANCNPSTAAAQAASKALKGAWEVYKAVKDGFDAADGAAKCFSCLYDLGKPILGRSSWDPNIKTGPGGPKPEKYISGKEDVAYTIHFENLAAATAPALEVVVTDTLDLNKLEAKSFAFTGFGFGDTAQAFINKDTTFAADIDLRPSKNTIVRVKGNFEPSTGAVAFHFTSYDPATMSLTNTINDGFLPPNTDGTSGQGSVSFLVKPKTSLATGDLIENIASIVFDANPAIRTPAWKNTIDKQLPVSAVAAVADHVSDSTYRIYISGNDAQAGIKRFSIYYSHNDSDYQLLRLTKATDFLFKGIVGDTYKFYSVATDSVNNIEAAPATPDLLLFINPAILPVTWLEFKAYRNNTVAQLEWKTASEFNNRGFEIQRSAEGTNFIPIGWINSSGNSTTVQSYSFTDNIPLKGFNFYRLKQTDIDGHSKFSEVRRVVFGSEPDFILTPNPAHDKLQAIFSNVNTGQVSLLDISGRILWQTSYINHTIIPIPVEQLAPGVYFIRLQSKEEKIITKKFIKD